MTGDLLSVEAALDLVLRAAGDPLHVEDVPLDEALGRVLAEPVTAALDLPPWDNSAMDGYAIRSADVAAASEDAPALLRVVGEVAAGAAPGVAVTAGVAVRIATGAPVPPGADTVVEVEATTPIDGEGRRGSRGRDATGPLPAQILVHAATRLNANVRRRAGDLRAGAVVLQAGTALGAGEIALAAAAGKGRVPVHRRPIMAVISTGDELRPAGSDPGPSAIFDSNGPLLVAAGRAAGADARHVGIAPDRAEPMLAMLRTAIEDADLVVVSGGVSVGPYDVVRQAFETVGSVDLWRVAVQPGKPFAFGSAPRIAGEHAGPPGGGATGPVSGAVSGRADGTASPAEPGPSRRVLLFGLPGNPVSSFVTFSLFVRPAIRHLAGRSATDLGHRRDRGVLAGPVTKAHGRRAFLRVMAGRDADGLVARDAVGRVRVSPAGAQESHLLAGLVSADALAVVPESADGLPAGAEVELWWLDRQ